MSISESGDVGLCRAVGHTSALTRTWDGHTVTAVDCDYKTCGYADICEMYQREPVGYQSVPSSEEKPEN
ncbi:hypothetical protein AALC25_15435 [Lachnospiraceae bacterium 29-84]